jgi:hypothetical protein
MEDLRGVKIFSLGLLFGVVLVGCVSAKFPYNFYYLDLKSYDGTLTGDKPVDDLPASTCAIGPDKEHGCVVMLKASFETMYEDYIQTKNDLNACQKTK